MSAPPEQSRIEALTELLVEREVDYIVVGGVAAIVHGSPTHTNDYDAVHSREPANVERLHRVLMEIDAYFRNDLAKRRLVPTIEHLQGHGQLLLATRLGPLDLLCQLHDGRGYDELLPHSVTFSVRGRPLRVLDLPTLIEVKTAAGRDKDKIAVAHLLKILDRQTQTP